MRVVFSTVVRTAPPDRGGELVVLDWERKEILARTTIRPTDPDLLDDPNPRGNTRGGRGIALLEEGILVCSYHSLLLFDRELRPLRRITHPRFVSLHEVAFADDGTLWTTSTGIDAALRVDLRRGEVVEERHPRSMPGLAAELGLEPLELPRDVDPRTAFLGREHIESPHHLHLNAVGVVEGRLLALFSKHGVVADLDHDRVVLRHASLKGSHNLRPDGDGRVRVCHTLGRALLTFDTNSGRRVEKIRFGDDPALRRRLAPSQRRYRIARILARLKLRPKPSSRPGYVRGLAAHGDSLFVGLSPATIVEIDRRSGRVLDRFDHSDDVRCCVHGLEVEP